MPLLDLDLGTGGDAVGNVGGDPTLMRGAAATLSTHGTLVKDAGRPIIDAGVKIAGATGHAGLAAAVQRVAAAVGTTVEDTGIQVQLSSQLAAHSADDLTSATGGP